MRELEYPFDARWILKEKKCIQKRLLREKKGGLLKKRIAVLGGVTTKDICQILELFLLNYGIEPEFYESEYNKYYEDSVFCNDTLRDFQPELVYICTSVRNIDLFPQLSDEAKQIEEKLNAVIAKYHKIWKSIRERFCCPIIQNNFEYPFYRLLGNMDASDIHGRVNFVTRLNYEFYNYVQKHENMHICDINYLSAVYGLDKWSEPFYWYMYKYAVAVPAIPYLSFNIANIIKSIYGKNKKALNLDLDHTLWGGIIGDDGVDNIEIGQETPLGQAFSEFQEYLKLHKQRGILLTINSKNEEEIARNGLKRPDSVLHPNDFVSIKANWNPKYQNLVETAHEMELLPESYVFVDDNPAERESIRRQNPDVAVPEMNEPEQYIQLLDRSGFFEATSLTQDDLKRDKMYQENARRIKMQTTFEDYEDYLKSLEMKGEIQPFVPMYMSRIAQLTNKSNQFNLTTRRYTQSELEAVALNENQITLYGRLMDKFGDNGVVSAVIGKIAGKKREELHIELWLMSCRVLKRDMEYAMMDELAAAASNQNIEKIYGYYYPTAKNRMVKDFYSLLGFQKVSEDEKGNTVWLLDISAEYRNKQKVIDINNKG